MTITQFITDLDLGVGETYRGQCPICHGKGTFTVSSLLGNIVYNCYKNSCSISGSFHSNIDAFTLQDIMLARKEDRGSQDDIEQDLLPFIRPPYLVPYKEVDTPIDPMFLGKYGIDPADVWYDIRQDRVVFPIVEADSGMCVDGVGRSLTNRKPKWLRYASSPVPYSKGGRGGCAVIVEDAISAYVVGKMFPEHCGVALLGTTLTLFAREYIEKRWGNAVIVALDPDARDKTIKIARQLGGKALNLKDDLKYKQPKDMANLKEMLHDK